MDIAVFIGYDVSVFDEYVKYLKASFQQAVRVGVKYIFLIGGKTKRYAMLTQAEMSKKIMNDCLPKDGLQPEIIVLPVGKTPAEGLVTVKKWIIDNSKSVGLLLLCGKQSQMIDFQSDALRIGLLDMFSGVLAYGHPFLDYQKEKRCWFSKLISRKKTKEIDWAKQREILRNIK